MYGKEIRKENKKEKGNKKGKWEEREIREGNEKEMRKLSDCSPFNIQCIHRIIFLLAV